MDHYDSMDKRIHDLLDGKFKIFVIQTVRNLYNKEFYSLTI